MNFFLASMKLRKAKAQLAAGDYKVIKCMEASLKGLDTMPYDVDELIASRDALRAEVNEYESIVAESRAQAIANANK